MTRETMIAAALALPLTAALAAESAGGPAPAKVLLISGGCCHDYATQKDLIKNGLEKRLNVEITQMYSADTSVTPPLPSQENAQYAEGYDLVSHDECAAGINHPAVIERIITPHRAGIPGINLHCAMHSYRFGDFTNPVPADAPNAVWFKYLGLQSFRHGPHLPLSVRFTDAHHPANAGLKDWVTGNEELYHVVQVMPGSTVLARGSQKVPEKDGVEKTEDHPIVWVHEYGPAKARVWSTSLGHYNETVADDRYLDMLANGVVWALNRDDLRKTAK
ncbi:MAG: ThuA domain-containing protein [Chthoniobacterales bacterium]